jgi:hypothetical protein
MGPKAGMSELEEASSNPCLKSEHAVRIKRNAMIRICVLMILF